jgi:hypothetical protein
LLDPIRSARIRASAALVGMAVLATACGESGSVQSSARDRSEAAAQAATAPAAAVAGTARNDRAISVSGEITFAGQGDPLRLAPSRNAKSFDLDITAVGTVYKVVLSDASRAGAASWSLEVGRSPVSGNQNWSVSLKATGTDPFTCGGLTMTAQPRLVRCDAAEANLSADRTTLTLRFSGTQVIANNGQRTGDITGMLQVVFPAPLKIARLDEYPSRSSASVWLNGEPAGVSAVILHPANAGAGSRLEALLEAPAVANGVSVDARGVQLSLSDQSIPGASTQYSCGRPLTDAEYACLEAPITMGRACDRSFLREARQCRSVVHSEADGVVRAEFDEALYDDITSRQVQSVRARARLASGLPMRGRISSADGRFVFSCDGKCNVARSVSATRDDVVELSILSSTSAAGTDHVLSIKRSLLYPDRVTVMLDLDYRGSGESPAVHFDDETSEIRFESLRLANVMGTASVVLSGSLEAFAR